MNAREIADEADMIVAGYAYKLIDDYVEVIDINDLDKRAIIFNGQVIESVMSDEEDDVILKYFERNKELMEGLVNA